MLQSLALFQGASLPSLPCMYTENSNDHDAINRIGFVAFLLSSFFISIGGSVSLSGSSSDTATYSPLHIRSANFGGIGGVDDANTTGVVVPGSSPIAGIGVATIPEGTDVLLFPSMLLAR